MRKAIILLLLCLIAGIGALAADFYRFIHRPAVPDKTVVNYEIEPGVSFRRVAVDLHHEGLIGRPLYWRAWARLKGQADTIKAGHYRLEGPLAPGEILAQFVQGKTVRFSLTLPEGWTFARVYDAVIAHLRIIRKMGANPGEELMAKLGKPAMSPEGWFFPDTYFFPAGTTDVEFLTRAHRAMEHRLQQEWASRDQGLPLNTPYEALILASIVEKETGAPAERAMIAAVFLERLERGMRLQTDPTVIYGLGGDYDGDIQRADLRRDTPYNTYLHAGLPPTPIAMPGGKALFATLHPAETQALFFVSRGDGSHVFSETYEQHRKAVIEYQLKGDPKRYNAQE